MFWFLLGTSAVIAVLALPLNENRRLMAVLEELLRFQKGFDQKSLEQSLRQRATQQKTVSLTSVVEIFDGKQTPRIEVNSESRPIIPLANIDLGTLNAVNAFSDEKASVDVLVPDKKQLTASLEWRLARKKGNEKFNLIDVTLEAGDVSVADVELEQKVATAHRSRGRAQSAWEEARETYDRLSKLHEMRLKWKAPWKVIQKTQEKVNEAKVEMEEKKTALDATTSEYEKLARKAEQFRLTKTGSVEPSRDGSYVIAVATLRGSSSSDPFRVQFPISADKLTVPVARLTGCDFSITKAAGLWDSLKEKNASEAIALIESRFSWHYHRIKIMGVGIGGMTLLQLSPIILVVLLLTLMRRIDKAQDSYNPYSAGGDWVLPIVGFNLTVMNFLAIVLLPTGACILCVWSLLLIKKGFLLPLICGLFTLVLGFFCHLRMDALRNLRNEVTRSHSIPPVGSNR